MRLANALVVCAVVYTFGQMLGLVALAGKFGYQHGWWGDGLGVALIAAAIAVAATAIVYIGIARWLR